MAFVSSDNFAQDRNEDQAATHEAERSDDHSPLSLQWALLASVGGWMAIAALAAAAFLAFRN